MLTKPPLMCWLLAMHLLALGKLSLLEPDLGRLVDFRFLAGLRLEEVSALVGRSERSLKRDWRRARAFLYAELGGPRGAEVAL